MNVVVSVVNVAWRIVSDEHINWRKGRKKLRHLILIVKKVTSCGRGGEKWIGKTGLKIPGGSECR